MNNLTVKFSFFLFFLATTSAFSQNDPKCENHPLFNQMPQHEVNSCEVKEFNEIKLYQTDKKGSRSEFEKSGEYLKVAYSFTGEWEKRPSPAQIYQNYINAVVNAGGNVLYKSASAVHMSLKKSGDQYWIVVLTDGSGVYYVTTVKEASMKQDIVVSAEQIKKDVTQEGKSILYGIYFETGKATLKAESAPTLTEIARYLKGNMGISAYIVGHTDNVGGYEGNMKLSLERAQTVVNELIKIHGVAMARLQPVGVGAVAPVASNVNEEGKVKNRRVEMVLK